MNKLSFNLMENQFYVGEITLVAFLIYAISDAGIGLEKLENDCGLNHPQLCDVVRGRRNKPNSQSMRSILMALETLGFSLELHG